MKIDRLFAKVHYLQGLLGSVCYNRDFCGRGDWRAPLPASRHGLVLTILELPMETTAMQERLWWEKDCDCPV